MAFGPTARHVGEHGQNRQFIIVVPKNQWIVPAAISDKNRRRVIRLKARRKILPLINADFHRSEKEIRV